MAKKRYSYRAYPTGAQAKAALRLFGCCRVVYNDFLIERERLYRAGEHREVPFKATASLVTAAAKTTPERAWLADVSSVPLQQSIDDACRAYGNWFDSMSGKRKGPRIGKPRRKRRGNRQKARFTKNARFKVLDTGDSKWGKVRLPKIGEVRFARSRLLPAEPSSVTLILEPDGTYWLSFVVEVTTEVVTPAKNPGRVASIDAGIGNDLAAIVYSDGSREKIANPRIFRTNARKLARQQRALSRKTKGSANRAKARLTVAKTHRKMAQARLDHHRKLAARLVAENDAITIEDLCLRGMGRTRLAKSVHDAGIGTLFQLIESAAENQGRLVTKAGRWEPTTQTCSVCGTPGGKKPLHIRTWTCTGCRAVLDRDYNAAVNIMVAAGLAETLNACGPGVRLRLAGAARDEAGTHRTDLDHVRAA